MTDEVLALNGGSSSLKYAWFADDQPVVRGEVKLGVRGVDDHRAAVNAVLDELAGRGLSTPFAVGHRIVHGGPDHHAPARVDPNLLSSLARATPFAPLHLPAELLAIDAVERRFNGIPQIVCFDTAFHAGLPMLAQRFALPASLFERGVRRYGFHGLSYEHVVASLGPSALRRAVLAHLGSGASMVAVREGHAVETTMGLTPSGGLVMGTRAGDLDPGLIVYLLEHCGYDPRTLDRLVNRQGGLLALSGTTADMGKLLAARETDERAALAVEAFCYHARKWVGALAAVVDGLEAIVFTGGIGQHAPEIRDEICGGLRHLGVRLDRGRNVRGEGIISQDASECVVHVVAADEERVIARHTRRLLCHGRAAAPSSRGGGSTP